MKRGLLWILPLLSYLFFSVWYTNTGGRLSMQEIESFSQKLKASGYQQAQIENLRSFMKQDSGRQFIMLNNLEMAKPPLPTSGIDESLSADELMAVYMSHMMPRLISRASHPIYAGHTVYRAMDVTGIEGATVWDQGALMRYRSRRDIMEIIVDPDMKEKHGYKIAALSKTIAYPLESDLYYSDLRFILALFLFSLISLIDLFIYRTGK